MNDSQLPKRKVKVKHVLWLQFSFDKSADSAVDGGRLLERAIESMLRRGLREQGWMSFGNLFVHGNLTAGVERCVVDTLAMVSTVWHYCSAFLFLVRGLYMYFSNLLYRCALPS
jgi:hypothetical protein